MIIRNSPFESHFTRDSSDDINNKKKPRTSDAVRSPASTLLHRVHVRLALPSHVLCRASLGVVSHHPSLSYEFRVRFPRKGVFTHRRRRPDRCFHRSSVRDRGAIEAHLVASTVREPSNHAILGLGRRAPYLCLRLLPARQISDFCPNKTTSHDSMIYIWKISVCVNSDICVRFVGNETERRPPRPGRGTRRLDVRRMPRWGRPRDDRAGEVVLFSAFTSSSSFGDRRA